MVMPHLSTPCYSAFANAYTIRIHTLNIPALPPHTDSKMFLVICELIDKPSGSLGVDHNGVDRAIGNRFLNKVIVGVNKGLKATCK